MDLLDRFARYEKWPDRGLLWARAFNPQYHRACAELLDTPEEIIDVGFGLALLREARSRGGTDAALNWLQPPGVQEFLVTTAKMATGANLPGEREVATVKNRERSKLCHLAGVSAKRIQRAVLRKRNGKVGRILKADLRYQASRKMRVNTLALQRMPAELASSQAPEAPPRGTLAERRRAAAEKRCAPGPLERRRAPAKRRLVPGPTLECFVGIGIGIC